jgi:lipopolysaccharide transport protein LptA
MKTLILQALSLLLISSQLNAEEKATEKKVEEKATEKKSEKKIPIKITSDKMKYHENGLIIFFTDNVNVDDGQMKLNCDFMTVKLDKEQSPKLIICEKNVVIRKEGSVSYSDRAEYFLPEEKILLTGKPKVISTNDKGEKQTMTGNEIIFYRNSNVIESRNTTIELPGATTENIKEKEQKK